MKNSAYYLMVMVALSVISMGVSVVMGQQSLDAINYQGKLTQSNGSSLPDGTYNMFFEIFELLHHLRDRILCGTLRGTWR